MKFLVKDRLNRIRFPQIRFSDDEFYFFIHIPKTAGTHFRTVLNQHVSPADILPNPKTLAVEQGGKYLKFKDFVEVYDCSTLHKQCHIFCAHFGVKVVERHLSVRPKVITFVRDPLARTISHLKHLQRSKGRYHNLSLEEIWKDNTGLLRNNQVRHLSHNMSSKSDEEVLHDIEAHFFVGITEQFDKSLAALQKKTGWTLQDSTSHPRKPSRTPDIPDSLLNRIMPRLERDYLIYNRVVENFESAS